MSFFQNVNFTGTKFIKQHTDTPICCSGYFQLSSVSRGSPKICYKRDCWSDVFLQIRCCPWCWTNIANYHPLSCMLRTVLYCVIAGLFLRQTCLMDLHISCLTTTTVSVMPDDTTCQKCLCTMLRLLKLSLQAEIRGAVLAYSCPILVSFVFVVDSDPSNICRKYCIK